MDDSTMTAADMAHAFVAAEPGSKAERVFVRQLVRRCRERGLNLDALVTAAWAVRYGA